MTRDEIISMAREVGFVLADSATDEAVERFRRLIELAAKVEREACANACEAYAGTASMFATSRDARTHNNAVNGCAAAIRARGDA